MGHLKRYFLLYTLIPLIVLSLAASFFRFMVTGDYMVSHEAFCDPYQEECFVYCEDDECIEPFYYVTIQRKASDLMDICGDLLVPDCEAAQKCQPNENKCTVTYCTDPNDQTCESMSVADEPRETDIKVGEIEITEDNM